MLYHVGSKDEKADRTGFAHFFEHLLFEGTENIERGTWFKKVTANGGKNNAHTTHDYTYYYEVFPSNNLELGLWLESERMLHPVINEIGVETQNEVVKEEKRLRYDNSPYGRSIGEISKRLFDKHPYKRIPIGKMEHLDAATLEEFMAFNKKYYIPNNAVLVIAGDFEIDHGKQLVMDYFNDIPKGEEITRKKVEKTPITTALTGEAYDPNIQVPALFCAYRVPEKTARESKVLDMISSYLSDGKSSKLYRKLVDEKKMSLQVAALNLNLEDYGVYIIYSLPVGDHELSKLQDEIDVDGKKAYEIKFSESQTHFYDVETHLKIQTLQTIEIMGNVQTSTIKYEDYKSVDGIYFPHKTTVSAGPQEIDFITQTIELNSTLEESLFK